MIGVSPAYFISRYSNRFSADDVAAWLEELTALGFQGFQLEVFHRESLGGWLDKGAAKVRERSLGLGLHATQFVAHFMLEAFADPHRLFSDAAVEQMKTVLEIVDRFDECRVITVPVPAFQAEQILTAEVYQRMFDRCLEKIQSLLSIVEGAGRRLALEILPSAIIGGMDGFLRLCDGLGAGSPGLSFDTGHAWAAKENLYLIPAKLGDRILGTHLCDNFGHEDLSLRPGTGSIDWPRIMGALRTSGYMGAYDIEIICTPDQVANEYGRGRAFIENMLYRRNPDPVDGERRNRC